MRRVSLCLFSVSLLSTLALASGCGKKNIEVDEDRPTKKWAGGGGEAERPAVREPLKAPADGVIKGRVVLKGERPEMAIVKVMAGHQDHAVCEAGTDVEKKEQKWIVGKDNGVEYAVVFLKPPTGKYFVVSEEDKKAAAGKKVVIDQPHCAFIPHVAAAFPSFFDGKTMQPTGEEFIVKNSAPINHNTKWAGDPRKTGEGNETIKSKGQLPINLVPEANPIQIECSIHAWMNARVWAFDHPYFAVTGPDGSFEIKNVPTGVELNLVAWHEVAQYFNGGRDGVKQKFSAGENKVDLTVSAK